jgi:hypothetical protein
MVYLGILGVTKCSMVSLGDPHGVSGKPSGVRCLPTGVYMGVTKWPVGSMGPRGVTMWSLGVTAEAIGGPRCWDNYGSWVCPEFTPCEKDTWNFWF